MSDRKWHLITYDVRDPKRLRQVAGKLESYGERIQYSVFRCRLDHESLEKLHWELNQIMASEDDLLVLPICASCAGRVPIHSTGDQSDWIDKPVSYRVI
jgi:CRISPR-associated protein Cas2